MGCEIAKSDKKNPIISIDTTRINFRKEYSLKELIGKGKYAKVMLAENDYTKGKVAVKIIAKENYSNEEFIKGINALLSIKHPNIVKYIKHFETSQYYYVIMEYCGGGALFDKILNKEHFTEKESAAVIRDALSAVSFLHDHGIIHRDLKPENIMYTSEGVLKIIDFGFAMEINSSDNKNLVGTSYYIAPEIVKCKTYTRACDIWSLGIILHAMLFGYLPIGGLNIEEIHKQIKTYKGPKFESSDQYNISSQAKNLLKRMLDINYKTRISAKDALNHPWFNILNDDHKKNTLTDNGIIKNVRKKDSALSLDNSKEETHVSYEL